MGLRGNLAWTCVVILCWLVWQSCVDLRVRVSLCEILVWISCGKSLCGNLELSPWVEKCFAPRRPALSRCSAASLANGEWERSAAEQALSGLLDLPPTISSLVFALLNVGAQLRCLREMMSILPCCGISGVAFLVLSLGCGACGITIPPLMCGL